MVKISPSSLWDILGIIFLHFLPCPTLYSFFIALSITKSKFGIYDVLHTIATCSLLFLKLFYPAPKDAFI